MTHSDTQSNTATAGLRRRLWLTWTVILLGLVVACTLGMLVGQGSLDTPDSRRIFFELRAWRIAAAFGIGAALAMAGVIVQAVFQNPLAGPSIIGTTAGAGLGGQLALIGYQSAVGLNAAHLFGAELVVPIGAVAGAITSLFLLLSLTRRAKDLLVTLLIGFLLSSFFASIGAYVISKAQQSWELGRAVLAFSMGSISAAGPSQVSIVLCVALVGGLAAMTWHRHLDLLLTGDNEAASLGLDVAKVRRWGVVWTGILSAGAVAVGGNIAFVGLIVPHALRPFVGYSTAALLPSCAFAGGTFVIFCDVLSRVGPGRSETPLGVITGLIGAPIFLYLLSRAQRSRSLDG